MSLAARPLLVYDGECGFCRYWVRYWQRLTGERVEYRTYQSLELPHRGIDREQFAQAIFWFDSDGPALHGAAAAFRVLATVPGHGGWDWCYRRIPGISLLAEAAYRAVAAHRALAAPVARALWGPERWPETYALTSWWFLRGLALVYLAAFASFLGQITGLVGSEGVLPLAPYLEALRGHYGASVYRLVPTVFWIDAGDTALRAVCIAGIAAAGLAFTGFAERATLLVCFALYLSLFYAGQVFTTFQWDLLLLECGFIALFLPGAPSPLAIGLQRWLLARFMFMSGWVKLASGDAAWSGMTALQFHFETQPLPTAIAWYAHQLPAELLRAAVGVTLFIELVLPWFVFAPRRLRHCAAWAFLGLESVIFLTGNYNFFNLLTMLLCLTLFDDAALRRLSGERLMARSLARTVPSTRLRRAAVLGAALVVIPPSLVLTGARMLEQPLYGGVRAVAAAFEPLRIVNVYGVFAVMTVDRNEIVIEGSNDGAEWLSYEFRYKPGALGRAPRWNAPHQPRVDWQMWFAALSDADHQPWFQRLIERLLVGAPPVLDLLESNPFPGAPPRYVRARFYRYRFTTAAQRAQTGEWWSRVHIGEYFPPVSLRAAVTEPR
jgi:predicted DCC family thiol-disulfide oxidoreductase YuxK